MNKRRRWTKNCNLKYITFQVISRGEKMKASNNPENLLKFLLNKLRYFDVNWTTNANGVLLLPLMLFVKLRQNTFCITKLAATGFAKQKPKIRKKTNHIVPRSNVVKSLGIFHFDWQRIYVTISWFYFFRPVAFSFLTPHWRYAKLCDRREYDVYELNINRRWKYIQF